MLFRSAGWGRVCFSSQKLSSAYSYPQCKGEYLVFSKPKANASPQQKRPQAFETPGPQKIKRPQGESATVAVRSSARRRKRSASGRTPRRHSHDTTRGEGVTAISECDENHQVRFLYCCAERSQFSTTGDFVNEKFLFSFSSTIRLKIEPSPHASRE